MLHSPVTALVAVRRLLLRLLRSIPSSSSVTTLRLAVPLVAAVSSLLLTLREWTGDKMSVGRIGASSASRGPPRARRETANLSGKRDERRVRLEARQKSARTYACFAETVTRHGSKS